MVIFPEIQSSLSPPKVIYTEIRDRNNNMVSGAFCRADIITKDKIIKDRLLYEISNFTDYLPSEDYFGIENKGYYKLETGLTDQDDIFEINVTCITIGSTVDMINIIYNNTNLPCNIMEGYLIC